MPMRTILSLKRAGMTSLSAVCCASLLWAGGVSAQSPPAAPEVPVRADVPALPSLPAASPAAAGAAPAVPADGSPDAKAIQAAVDEYLKQKDAQKKADDEKKKAEEERAKQEAEAKGYEVGSDLKMNVRWNPENGVRFETPNKDFTSHIGFRFQDDWVWWTQTSTLRPVTQVGDLQDGTFFRRIRPSWDGTAWEVIEWNCELALEQVRQGIPTLDEVWAGVTKVPYIGTIRVGNIKVPQGFEGDMVSSSKAMTFLERAAYTDAFYENFAPGIWTGNSVLDQRVTWSGMAYRQELSLHDSNGADFGDGEYAYSGRMTALPLWDCDGRHLLHLGVSGTWRKALKLDPGLGGPAVVRFRARPAVRDALVDFGSLPRPGISQRWFDTWNIVADSATVIGTELFYVLGPFSLQAENAWAIANSAVVNNVGVGDPTFRGGYIQVSYFLTGENRT